MNFLIGNRFDIFVRCFIVGISSINVYIPKFKGIREIKGYIWFRKNYFSENYIKEVLQ